MGHRQVFKAQKLLIVSLTYFNDDCSQRYDFQI